MSVALLQTPPLTPSLPNLLTQKLTYHSTHQNCADNEAASKRINWTFNDRGKWGLRTRTVAFLSVFPFKATSPLGRNITEGRRNNHKLKKIAGSSGKVGLSKLASHLPPAEHLLLSISSARTLTLALKPCSVCLRKSSSFTSSRQSTFLYPCISAHRD